MKTYKFVEFTSQLKIGLKLNIGLISVERVYLVYGILENAKTCRYGKNTSDVFETNPVT